MPVIVYTLSDVKKLIAEKEGVNIDEVKDRCGLHDRSFEEVNDNSEILEIK